jgi:hypothetical protein
LACENSYSSSEMKDMNSKSYGLRKQISNLDVGILINSSDQIIWKIYSQNTLDVRMSTVPMQSSDHNSFAYMRNEDIYIH